MVTNEDGKKAMTKHFEKQKKVDFLKILYLFLFIILISSPSLLSIPMKGRESGGIVVDTSEQHKELQCIKNALWHEARGETEEGIRAVMSVIYNRKNHKNYPNTFCKVILQDKQFSAFNQDKSLATKRLKPVKGPDKEAYRKVSSVAQEAVQGAFKPVLEPSVLWYTTHGVQRQWTKRLKIHLEIGGHKFYGG